MQEQYADLKELGVEVYSVSTDTHFTHKAWHDHSDAIGKLEYIMIGDPSHTISLGFDVLDESGLSQRGTFIIDPDGVVQALEINADGVGRDASVLIDKSMLHNMYGAIQVKFAQLNGKKELKHLLQVLI